MAAQRNYQSSDQIITQSRLQRTASLSKGRLSKDEQTIWNKVAYEWKGIFRDLTLATLDLAEGKNAQNLVGLK